VGSSNQIPEIRNQDFRAKDKTYFKIIMPFIPLDQLKIYQLSRQYGRSSWQMYQNLGWEIKKVSVTK